MKNKLVEFVRRLILAVNRHDKAVAMGERVRKRVLEKLAAQQGAYPTVLESGQIEDHNFVDGVCTFCGKAQPHSG
jgi:hypothetical protein